VVPTFRKRRERWGTPPDEGAVEVKVNVKSNGQECPFHTGKSKSNINVKNRAAGVRGSHLSQKTRKMGHAL